MDIKKQLAEEHSKALTLAIVKYIGDDKKKFKVLMFIFLHDEYILSQRASWPLSYLAIEHPKLINPYFNDLIKKLNEPKNHPAISRHILKIFQEIEIPQKFEASIVESCFKIIISTASSIASKAFAITVATSICKKYPELKNELNLHLEWIQNYPMTAAIKVRIKKALKDLSQVNPKV